MQDDPAGRRDADGRCVLPQACLFVAVAVGAAAGAVVTQLIENSRRGQPLTQGLATAGMLAARDAALTFLTFEAGGLALGRLGTALSSARASATTGAAFDAAPASAAPASTTTSFAAARAIAPSSRALGRALEAAGHVRPPGSAAHHIVAGGAERAAPARAVLDRFGIGIHDAANGEFLPSGVHARLHTNAYYETVNSALSQATTRQEALQVLDALRRGLP